jgi:uncharacterized repeat protein (TIGR03803 family)
MKTLSRSMLCAAWVYLAVVMLAGCGVQSATSLLPAQTANEFSTQPLSKNGYGLLYSFKGGTDGEYPFSGLTAVGGALYGTTLGEDCTEHCSPGSAGTVFQVTTSGQESVLYSFGGPPDGSGPEATLLAVNGDFYGTTPLGGSGSCGGGYGFCGIIYNVTKAGKETILSNFQGDDGEPSGASLVYVNGNFYGVTEGGGLGHGIVYELSPSGTIEVIYEFKGYPHDGDGPTGLTYANGEFYGVTSQGGGGCNSGCGTVFKLSLSGKEHVLHSFKGAPDGSYPSGTLLFTNGSLFGTTSSGGASKNCPTAGGCGTVFQVTPSSGTEHVIYSFRSGSDGEQPDAGLVSVKGALFGTTDEGGAKCAPSGRCGTIFELSPSGQERVLYKFKGQPDGEHPTTPLLAVHDVLYGTTVWGGTGDCSGSPGCGTIFRIAP